MKISVLTPSCNSGKYLERAIQSVLQQDYDKWEHIVVDGGSTDNTLDILKKYSHIKWISEPDKGQSDAMNKAFAMSSGEIIMYLNSDDEIEKNVFELIIKTFQENIDCDIVVGNIHQIWSSTKAIVPMHPSIDLLKIVDYTPYSSIYFPANPVGYYYKRHIQEKVGGYSLQNHYAMDYEFLLNAYKHANRIIKVDKIFGKYYIHDNNKSSDIERGVTELYKTKQLFLKNNKDVKLSYKIYQVKNYFRSAIFQLTAKIAIRTRLKKLIKIFTSH